MGLAQSIFNRLRCLVEGPTLRERTVVKVVRTEDHLRCAPTFLIGVYRSGTTLLRFILDSHSRIAVPPESNFLVGVADLYRSEWHRKGLAAVGVDADGLRQRLAEFASQILDDYTVAKGKARWIDKTPAYVEVVDFLADLFGPRARFLMLYRHGLDVANSLAVAAEKGTVFAGAARRYAEEYAQSPRLAYTRYWVEMCERMLAFEAAHPGQCLRLRYEDIVADPERVLRPVFEFLGEPWEPAVLDFHDKPHDFGLQDHKILETKGFRPSLRNYEAWPAPDLERAGGIAAPMLDRLGYDS